MKLWARIREWARGLLYSATEYPAGKVLLPDRGHNTHAALAAPPNVGMSGDDQAAVFAAHAKALAAAEAVAERAAPIHRFKDGAEVVARDGQRYVASHVQKNGWHVSMTLKRTDKNRNDGLTGRGARTQGPVSPGPQAHA